MNRFKVLFLSILTTQLSFCGFENNAELRDVSNPGNPQERNSLLWEDSGLLVMGDCRTNELPTRENCPASKSVSIQAVVDKLAAEDRTNIASVNNQIQTEINALRKAHPVIATLRTELAGLEVEKTTTTQSIGVKENRLPELDLTINTLARKISDYDSQLAEVERRLQTTPTEALVNLKKQLESERNILVLQKNELFQEKETTVAAIAELKTNLAALLRAIEEKKSLIASRLTTLEVTSPKLDGLKRQLIELQQQASEIQLILGKIKDSHLSYRFNDLLANEKSSFNRIYSAAAFPPPAQPDVKLINGTLSDGILLVRKNGDWRGVCDDSFDDLDAVVACRSLGFRKVKSFQTATGPNDLFWMDGLACNGSEDDLFRCASTENEDCGSDEHIFISCSN